MAPAPKDVISGGLLRLLADTFVLLHKTRHLSWRVNGGVASDVRTIVQQDHRDLDETADRIARHILHLGREVPPSYADLVCTSSIRQELAFRSEMDMIVQIADDHERILEDIETLEVTLPLEEDPEAKRLLAHQRSCHQTYRERLAALLPPDIGARH